MADLYIGVNVRDAVTLSFRRPGFDNAPLNTAGFLVRSVRGIDDVMIFSDFDSAKRVLSGFDSGYYGMYAIKGFFENVGSNGVLFVKRLINTNTAVPASYSYNTVDGLGTAIRFRAGFRGNVDRGSWGNNLRVALVHNLVDLGTLSSDAVSGNNYIEVSSLDGFQKEDILRITDGTNTEYFIIRNIDEINSRVYLDSNLANDYTVADTSLTRIRYSVYIYYVDPTTGIPTLVEQFNSLSSNPLHSNYVENVINNTEVGSNYVVVDQVDNTGTYDKLPSSDPNPSYASAHALTGGTNGTNILPSQLTSFYHYFDKYPIRFVACTEFFGETAYFKGRDYADEMKDRVYVHNLPDLGMTGIPSFTNFDDIISWVKPLRKSLRYYSILLKDWIQVDDPLGTVLTPYKKIPIVGHLVGYMINQILKRGVHRVPANMMDSISGIVNLSNEVQDRAKLTELVENGINVVSKVGSGFYLRSSRTISLSKVERYLNTIMTLIYIKESLKGIMIPYENYPTEKLPAMAASVITAWAKNFYERSSNGGSEGGFGEGKFEEVFKLIIDESVNPKPQLAEGIVKALVYFVPPSAPAEKILLEVGLIDLT